MRWLYFGARNRLSNKGCHPFYEFPFDSAKICINFISQKLFHSAIHKKYENRYGVQLHIQYFIKNMENSTPTVVKIHDAFKGITTPMGVASYDNVKVKEIQDQLPSVEEFICATAL